MKNTITRSTLLEYFNGGLAPSEEHAVKEWSSASEENRKLFAEVQAEYLRMRWGVQASQVKVDYGVIRGRIAPKRRISPKKIIAAITVPAAAAVAAALLLLHGPSDPVRDFAAVAHTDNSVILELSDGSRYVVDTAGTVLVEKDGTQLSIEGGEIAYLNDNTAPKEVVYNKVTVPRGAPACRIRLGDGSVAWLNSDSRLEYPLAFTGGERKVRLTGEAFFDVAKDAAKPFIVESDLQSVNVLGTQFNVSAYPAENVVTTLVTGKVRVQPSHDKAAVTLAPGEQMRLDPRSESISVSQVNAEEFISWKEGTISVEDLPFGKILTKVSRKFDVEFDLADAGMDDMVLKGSIPAGESFETVLSILEKAADVRFKMGKDGKIKVVKL